VGEWAWPFQLKLFFRGSAQIDDGLAETQGLAHLGVSTRLVNSKKRRRRRRLVKLILIDDFGVRMLILKAMRIKGYVLKVDPSSQCI
jgi:hypothetical protein